MREDKATPRPWQSLGDGSLIAITDEYGHTIARLPREGCQIANAELIVRAVNNHDVLVEALWNIDKLYYSDDSAGAIARAALKKAGEL